MDKQSVVLGCGCEVFGDKAQELKQRFKLLRLLIASTALSMPLLWNLPPMVQLVFATALQLYPGMYFVRNALRGLRSLTMGMDLLVALSTTAIYALGSRSAPATCSDSAPLRVSVILFTLTFFVI